MKSADLTGQRFGSLVVAGRLPNSSRNFAMWHCRCDCGDFSNVRGASLKAGHTVSCGCAQRVAAAKQGKHNATHGHRRRGSKPTPTYNSWAAMLQRCENSKHQHFANYGGRGITVCERWHKFDNFLYDMGERPAGMSIDRKESNGNYEKSNCKWSTRKEQNTNRRSVSHV